MDGLVYFLPVLVVLFVLPVILFLRESADSSPVTGAIPKSMFAPRGGGEPYETHLFLFCVEDAGEKRVVRRLDRPSAMAEGMDSCAPRGELRFALTNLSTAYPYLYVFGIDEHQRRLWYFPKPKQGKSLAISTGIHEALLSDSILLRVNHRPGRARVFAIFSMTPVTDEDVDRSMKAIYPRPEALNLPLERSDIYVESFPIHMQTSIAH